VEIDLEILDGPENILKKTSNLMSFFLKKDGEN
jgi:hypothetical protein